MLRKWRSVLQQWLSVRVVVLMMRRLLIFCTLLMATLIGGISFMEIDCRFVVKKCEIADTFLPLVEKCFGNFVLWIFFNIFAM